MKDIEWPKFHRQRFILQFISFAGGTISKLDLQKLIFLVHQRGRVKYFDFIPYHYGSYSFSLNADIEKLTTTGWLSVEEHDITLVHKAASRMDFIKSEERSEIRSFFQYFDDLRGDELIQYVYDEYPYYASRSKMAKRFNVTPSHKETEKGQLFTIGYEGLTLETYLNKLIQNDISILCDIRKNPISRKFGFSKGVLSKTLPKLGIYYLHIPELGIVSDKRKKLTTSNDYKELFKTYKQELPDKLDYVDSIIKLLENDNNIALTCFECEHQMCHRSYLAEYIEDLYNKSPTHI